MTNQPKPTPGSVGFTGTRKGMTNEQIYAICTVVDLDYVTEFHHGGAMGADEEAHGLVQGHARMTHVHLCSESRRARFLGYDDTIIHDPRPPLVRNRTIVDGTERLIAAPVSMGEQRQSGTWMTIRYARKHGRPVTIIWPDGTVTEEPER